MVTLIFRSYWVFIDNIYYYNLSAHQVQPQYYLLTAGPFNIGIPNYSFLMENKKRNKSKHWNKYFNEEYQRYYWYNTNTNESIWEENDDIENSNEVDTNTITDIDINKHDDSSEMLMLLPSFVSKVTVTLPSKKRKSRLKSKTTTELFASNASASNNEDLELDVAIDTDIAQHGTTCSMSCMACIYVIIFEAPVLVLESILRGLIFTILGVCVLCGYCYIQIVTPQNNSGHLYKWILLCIKEISVCGSTAIITIIPGMLLYVYKDFIHPSKREYTHYIDLDSDEWLLHPLPTPTICMVGDIDMRRYFIIYYGYGSLSANMSVVHHSKLSKHIHMTPSKNNNTDIGITSDSDMTTNVTSNSTFNSNTNTNTNIQSNLFGNQDTWRGPLVLTPSSLIDLVYELLDSHEIENDN